jgi:hypothetical protein
MAGIVSAGHLPENDAWRASWQGRILSAFPAMAGHDLPESSLFPVSPAGRF